MMPKRDVREDRYFFPERGPKFAKSVVLSDPLTVFHSLREKIESTLVVIHSRFIALFIGELWIRFLQHFEHRSVNTSKPSYSTGCPKILAIAKRNPLFGTHQNDREWRTYSGIILFRVHPTSERPPRQHNGKCALWVPRNVVIEKKYLVAVAFEELINQFVPRYLHVATPSVNLNVVPNTILFEQVGRSRQRIDERRALKPSIGWYSEHHFHFTPSKAHTNVSPTKSHSNTEKSAEYTCR